MRSMLSIVFSTVLLAAPALVAAQTTAGPARPATAPATAPAVADAQQRETLARQDAQMSAAAARVAGLIDAGNAGQVWDGAAEVMRKATSRPGFIQAMAADRQRLGAVVQRGHERRHLRHRHGSQAFCRPSLSSSRRKAHAGNGSPS